MLTADIFSGIWDAFAAAVVTALNAVIVALAASISAVLSVLPDMPALPSVPSSFVLAEGWVAWFFPVGTVVDILTFAASMWLLWLGVSVVLRWAKFERGSG